MKGVAGRGGGGFKSSALQKTNKEMGLHHQTGGATSL